MIRSGALFKVKNFNDGALRKRVALHRYPSFTSKGEKELPFPSGTKGKNRLSFLQQNSFKVNQVLLNSIQMTTELKRWFSKTTPGTTQKSPAKKPLIGMTPHEVQIWFKTIRGGEFKEYASKFRGLSGKSLAGLDKEAIQKELGPIIGEALYNAIQDTKSHQEVNVAWLEEILKKKGTTVNLARGIEIYKKLDKPDPETQRKVLGNLFLRPWPLDTTVQDFSFMYSDTEIGKDSVNTMKELLVGRYQLIVGLGLSGAGKSHLATQLAVHKIANVLYYDCSRNRNASVIGDNLQSRRPKTEDEYYQLAADLEKDISNFTLANAFIYLQLVKSFKIEPVQFVRFMENGGIRQVQNVFEIINKEVDLNQSKTLKELILTEIKRLNGLPVVEVWDEAGILTQWASDSIPYSTHADNPKTVFNPKTNKLKNAGSAFTVACRVAKANISEKTLFFGTSLRLGNIEKDITGIGKQINLIIPQPKRKSLRTEIDTSKFMKLWSSETVYKSLSEDIKLEGNVSKGILDVVCYRLQGRPRLTTIFKRKLYKLKEKSPNISNDELFRDALEDTENEMRTKLRSALDDYLQGNVGGDLHQRVKERLRLMIDLVIKPSVEINSKEEHDLVDKGIVYIAAYVPPTANRPGKATYSQLEPLVMSILYQILEEKGITFTDLIVDWMKSIYRDINSKKEKQLKLALSAKGKAAEVLLAHVLILVSKELKGRPITEHELFAEKKGTFLDDYTLMVDNFQYDNGDLWRVMMETKRTDIALLPTNFMRPDLFLLLKCIKGTQSHKNFNDHVIPLTAGSKIFQSPDFKLYMDNVDSTDIQKIFTKNGRSHKNRKIAEPLLEKTFPVKRALRISLLYNPLKRKLNLNDTENEIFMKLDAHHTGFMETLKRNYKTATNLLNAFTSKDKILG